MKTQNPINIYIVEDNNVFALSLKAYIKTAYTNQLIQISLFETGEACMIKFKEEKPLVVILDYHLNSLHPEAVDGIEVLDLIKKESPDTNVVILTSDDNIDIAIKSFKHGACDYVIKSETQFMQINYSLLNIFKIIKEKSEIVKYKYIVKLFMIFIGVQLGIVLILILRAMFAH